MLNYSLPNVVDLLTYVYSHHTKANIIDQDGQPCYHCRRDIPLLCTDKISKESGRCFVKIDRSNRVDVQLLYKRNGKEVVSYHIECWKHLIFNYAG